MPAAMAGRIYPFPFRTRKSSAPAPMVLPLGGRVGRRRLFLFFLLCGPAAPLGRAGPVFFPLPPLCRLSPRPPRRRLRRFPAGGAGRHLLLLRGERFLMSCGASAEKSQGAVRPPPPGNLPGPSRTNCAPLSPRPGPPLWLCALWRRCLVGDSSGAGGVPERGGGMERAAADSPARARGGKPRIKRQVPFRRILVE